MRGSSLVSVLVGGAGPGPEVLFCPYGNECTFAHHEPEWN